MRTSDSNCRCITWAAFSVILTAGCFEAPTPDPRLGLGGTEDERGGELASVREVSIPGYRDNSSAVSAFQATNRGLYMVMMDIDSDAMTVLKLHAGSSERWSSAAMPDFQGYAPSNLYTEREDEVGFYWVGIDHWGRYTANGGGVSIMEANDMYATRVASGGTSGISASRPWVIAGGPANHNADYQYLWHDDGMYTKSNAASDRFTEKASEEELSDPSGALLLSHPSEPLLYVAMSGAVHTYSASGLEASATVPTSTRASFTQLTWYDGTLWVGYGTALYRLSNGSLAQAATIQDDTGFLSLTGGVPGLFCLRGGEILGADGMATRIDDGEQRSWISQGTLSSSQQLEESILRASLSSGIFCSGDSLDDVVYAPRQDTIRIIQLL